MQPLNCILLIDRDNINNYVSQRLILKNKLSNNVQITSSCKEAIEFIQRNFLKQGKFPQLILMESNIRFEQDDDYKYLADFIGSHKNEVQIAMLTNIIDHKDLDRIKSSGVDYILNKPLRNEDIINIVKHFQSRKFSCKSLFILN
jgi:CheY-like chemotaxis protein